ncbi:hypothetical protein ABIE45_003658 [Methylobacterium sp. OAE515]
MCSRPKELGAVTRSVPRARVAFCDTRLSASAMASTIGAIRSKKAAPISVGATRRVVRCSRRTASRSSSRFSRFETTATDRPSSDPAWVRLPVRTTRAKISRSL